ncbi:MULTISPECIES: hypothetical protein [Streptomyces]|uniref:hypothetical protein n=1 Tax=Streptomyces TaxID=1883 RepID=UPI0023DD1037|nr:hypothetical protein [Streptomyces sp. FXJ1.172]WEP00834.1 hypothetical protein A6P39_042455 [Streptomyces sp. FXJ1.172]
MTPRVRPLGAGTGIVCVVVAALATAGCVTSKDPADPTPAGSWTPTGRRTVNSLTGAEGVATREDGTLVTRGPGSIPLSVRAHGYQHVGDLDIAAGYAFDAYQGPRENSAKMFLVTTPEGKRLEYRHGLDAGELFNNSFAAVSPDHQWLVSGEFGVRKRLQVFPAPLLNKTTPLNGGALPQAGEITLDRPVKDVQGCDFFSERRLVCDAGQGEVFDVDLDRALDGKQVSGKVTDVLRLPKISKCSGAYEAEGVDYDARTRTLRASMLSPSLCKAATVIFSYHWEEDRPGRR